MEEGEGESFCEVRFKDLEFSSEISREISAQRLAKYQSPQSMNVFRAVYSSDPT